MKRSRAFPPAEREPLVRAELVLEFPPDPPETDPEPDPEASVLPALLIKVVGLVVVED